MTREPRIRWLNFMIFELPEDGSTERDAAARKAPARARGLTQLARMSGGVLHVGLVGIAPRAFEQRAARFFKLALVGFHARLQIGLKF